MSSEADLIAQAMEKALLLVPWRHYSLGKDVLLYAGRERNLAGDYVRVFLDENGWTVFVLDSELGSLMPAYDAHPG